MTERFVGVEEARACIGHLVEQVAESGDVVALTKRGRALAVLISRDEYAQLKRIASRDAREELRRRLLETRAQVRDAGLDPCVVDAALAAARNLP